MLAHHVVNEAEQRRHVRVILPCLGLRQRLAGATLVPLSHGQKESFDVAHC